MSCKREKHWMLSVVCWTPAGGYSWRNWHAKGRTAIDAFIKLTDFHEQAAREQTNENLREIYHSYGNADLVNAWEITAAQAQRFM